MVGELVAKAWKQTGYAHLPINEDKLRRLVHRYMSGENNRVFLSEIDGEVKGMLAVMISPMDICDGFASTDHCFYCESGEGKWLIRAYIKWAKKRECKMINMTVSSGREKADKLITACGFTQAGGVYYYE